jgi:voltage-dependent anion channel protein 2
LNASYFHLVDRITAVGAEVLHHFSSNATSIAFGAQHALDAHTLVKARVNSYGIASALIQHVWFPNSIISLSAETDLMAHDGSCRVGLSLLLRP